MAVKLVELSVSGGKRRVSVERLKDPSRPVRLRVFDQGASGVVDIGLELSAEEWRRVLDGIRVELGGRGLL